MSGCSFFRSSPHIIPIPCRVYRQKRGRQRPAGQQGNSSLRAPPAPPGSARLPPSGPGDDSAHQPTILLSITPNERHALRCEALRRGRVNDVMAPKAVTGQSRRSVGLDPRPQNPQYGRIRPKLAEFVDDVHAIDAVDRAVGMGEEPFESGVGPFL
jgi:hypothetical protein